MKQMMSKIWSSSSVRNVGKLLSASVIAQAIGILVYPVLTRMYSPEDFGLLNLFVSIGGVFVVLSVMEWNNAIVLPKEEKEAVAVVHVSLLSVAASVLLIALSVPFATPIANIFQTPQLASYYWLMPFYVLLMALWNVLNLWYIRKTEYGRISGYQISQSLLSSGGKAGFGFLPFNGGLIFATVLSLFCSLVISIIMAGKKCFASLIKIDSEQCKNIAEKYSNFPKYSMPRALLNTIAGQLPVLLLTPVFGTRLVGFWGMSVLLGFVPVSTISRALYQVFFQKTTDWVNTGQSIAPFYRRFTVWTLLAVVPFFVVLWFILPSLTAWLLGDEWVVTGEYIRWFLPWLACNILSASTGYLSDIFFKQKQGLLFEILLAVTRASGVGIGIALRNFEVAVAGYAIGSAIVNLAQYIWMLTLVRTYEKGLA